jgi:hypothetical protein
MPVILKNNASSTLATAISASDTGIVVADGSKFPSLGASDYFYATLVSSGGTTEIIKVTARASNSMTVVRAQDGSSAASFASGALLEMRVNAASVTDLVDEHDQAVEISIADAGGYYTGTNVEAALQEAAQASTTKYTQGGTGASTRTVQARLQDYVSVKDFGAVGDGVTDDTAAIQAAITASPGRVIFFPNGKYKFTQTLEMTDVGIRGENIPQSNVANDPGTEFHYYGTGYAMIFRSWRGMTWENFLLKSYASNTSGICCLLFAGNLLNVRIEEFDQVSCRFGTGTLSTIVPSPSQVAVETGAYYWRVDNLLIYNQTISGSNAQRGLFVSGGFPSTNGNSFRNTVVFGRFDVLYEINGNTNRFVSGECTPNSPVTCSAAYRLGTAANSNSWSNVIEGVYYEFGTTTNFVEFGSGAFSNELRDFNYEATGAIQPKVSDLGWGNNVSIQPRGFNFSGSVENKTRQNLVSNSFFQHWVGSLPVNWFLSLGGGTWSQDSTEIHGNSPYSAKLVCAGNRGIIAFAFDSGLARNQTGQYKIAGLRGQTLVAAVWCKSSVAGFGNIKLGDGTSYGAATHTGSGNWELLTATIRVSDVATQVDLQLRSDQAGANQTGTIYFSEPVCFFGSELTSFEPRPITEAGGKMFGKFGHAPSENFTSGDTSPSVLDGNLFTTANAGATTIANFDDGWPGQIIYIRCNDANTTLANNANIQTTTGSNKLLSSGTVYKLAYFDKWREF